MPFGNKYLQESRSTESMRSGLTIAMALTAICGGLEHLRRQLGLQVIFPPLNARPLPQLRTSRVAAAVTLLPGSGRSFAGGQSTASKSPFGVLAAPNITPDRETGIGAWTDDEFDAAVRSGRSRNGARLYPAMPFPYYSRMSREDVKDIRAYLRDTIEPARNAVRVNRLPFPFNVRASMIAWGRALLRPGELRHPEHVKISGLESRSLSGAGARAVAALCHTPKTGISEGIRRPSSCRATHCKDGPRRGSPVGGDSLLATGRWDDHRDLSEDLIIIITLRPQA